MSTLTMRHPVRRPLAVPGERSRRSLGAAPCRAAPGRAAPRQLASGQPASGQFRARQAAVRPVPRVGRAGSVRLTRRGQVVLVVLLLALVLVALTAVGSRSAATDRPGTHVPTRTVQVGDGQTLWQIAAEVAAPGQTRQMVHQIQELNAMTGPGVTAGQTLAVPVR